LKKGLIDWLETGGDCLAGVSIYLDKDWTGMTNDLPGAVRRGSVIILTLTRTSRRRKEKEGKLLKRAGPEGFQDLK
jgi:hypothetical protein